MQAMATRRIFFTSSKFRIILKQVATFQREVEKDVTKYNHGTLIRLQNELVAIGREEFRSMATSFLGEKLRDIDELRDLIISLRDRYIGLWTQNITKAFATAEDSVEGVQNKLNRGRGILQRIFAALFGDDGERARAEAALKSNMAGIVRTRLTPVETSDGTIVKKRVIFRIGLVQHVKMLAKTMPANFFREADSLLLKYEARQKRVPRAQRLFRISNPGGVPESAETCLLVQGRVLTADALMFVQRNLSPNLFHPNCRHHILRSFKETLDTYDGRYGPVLTLKDVQKFVGSNKIRLRSRPNPYAIPV